MTTAYDDIAFRSHYEQLMHATQQQLHAPLKQQHSLEEHKQQPPLVPPHLAFTLSSPTSDSLPSPLSSTHSLLSQSAPDVLLPSISCCSSSLLLPHLTSLASSFASHQQHVHTTLLALQAAVAEERREREAEVKRSRRDEVSFRRRVQERVEEVRDECNDRLAQLNTPHLTPPLPATTAHLPPATTLPPPHSTADYDNLSRQLDSLRAQLHTLRADVNTLIDRSSQPQPPTSEVRQLMARMEGLEGLTALHTATIQQQSDHYTAYRTQDVREKEERRREADEANRRDTEEREDKQRTMRVALEAELRRLTDRMDNRDTLDRTREVERRQDRHNQQQSHSEQQQERDEQNTREAADRRRREHEQRMAAADERERQKRVQAQVKAEAELEVLRREQDDIDRQQERVKQEKARQLEVDRQRVEMERQQQQQQRERERLQVEEEQQRQREKEAAEQLSKSLQERSSEQQQLLATEAAISPAGAVVATATASTPYNVFIRLWNLPLSTSGNNNPIAALFLPSTTTSATSASSSVASTDGWQYCSQTEWMRDEEHPVFEQALLWDYDGTADGVKVSVYDVVDENVRDEDRLGSAIIPAHLLLTAASSPSTIVRPPSAPVPPSDAPINGLTFRLVHEDAVKQSKLTDIILMVECETDQPTTPQPPPPAAAAAMLLVRLATVALPVRANGALPSPIAAAFLQSTTDGELVYVDQTEWLKRTTAATFQQSMELEVSDCDGECSVRLSVYDVDSEEVRDEDRLGHVLLTVAELRSMAAVGGGGGGVGREMQLLHEDGVKERLLKASGSRVVVSVEVLADEELEFEVEERKAGRRAAPPMDGGAEDEKEEEEEEEKEKEEEGREVDEDENEGSSEEAEEEVEEDAEEEEVELEVEGEQHTDDDDVNLVVEAVDEQHHDNSTADANPAKQDNNTSRPADSVNAATHSDDASSGSAVVADSGSSGQQARSEQKEEVDEVYSDFGDSSSEEEEEEDDDEPQLQHDQPVDRHIPTDDGHKLPLMPPLASEVSDDEDSTQPANGTVQQHSSEPTRALNSEQQQQQLDESAHSKAHESSGDDGGSEIVEEIDVEFGADDDDSHFDLL